ncbi:MAG: glycosyltransferase family 2 protein [Oscillospiraceae bacterium]|nr:glycosyltransferase family 2 protein [Oscillospiraceae bacterium]
MKTIVLLSACNGGKYLREQLDSLIAQTVENVEILVRDDGSTDDTRMILAEYAERGALRWYAGENLGPARSFWRLLQDAEEADTYAFCDQDDVWDADKLEIAVSALARLDASKPALYCGDVRVTDAKLHVLAERMVRPAPADYPHALLRNLAPGCTYVFNRAAMELLRRFDAERLGIELHDWTAYQLAACFGSVVYDPTPHMRYRQHGDNAIGAHRTTVGAWLEKTISFWSGPMKNSRSRQALRLEQAFGEEMRAEDRELTALLAHYREDRRTKQKLLRMLRCRADGMDGRLARLLVLCDRL